MVFNKQFHGEDYESVELYTLNKKSSCPSSLYLLYPPSDWGLNAQGTENEVSGSPSLKIPWIYTRDGTGQINTEPVPAHWNAYLDNWH